MANTPTEEQQSQSTSFKSNLITAGYSMSKIGAPTQSLRQPQTQQTQATSLALDQYRLQLYNYALNIERLRCPPTYGTNGGAASMPPWLYPYATQCAGLGNAGSAADVSSGNRLAALSTISLFPQSQRMFQPEEPKPQHSYIGLIAMAILSSTDMKLVLSDIYQYILDHYPYFRTRGPGWRNSIRHNLSLNDCFIKSGRSANGKGHYWAIHPANMEDFRKGDFRRRKAQRKVRKHMGLAVDDTSTDSPSPPPLDLTSPPPPSAPTAHLAATAGATSMAALNYPYHQQYFGQFFGRSLPQYATTATALQRAQIHIQPHSHPDQPSSLNGNYAPQQQQHQQQHLHHQHHQHIAFINSTTTTTIANLYSQTRKRQFDVASLLAPDVQIVDFVEDEGSATQTVITKVQVQKQQTIHRELLVEHSSSGSSSQHVDPEADTDIDVDGDGEQLVDDNSYLFESARRCSFEQDTEVDQDQEPHILSISVSPASSISQHDSNSLEECPPATVTAPPSHAPLATTTSSPIPALPKNYVELNNVDPHILNRYYGTYVAAAAARHASLEASKANQATTKTTSPPIELLSHKS